jgi:hypothetical protein
MTCTFISYGAGGFEDDAFRYLSCRGPHSFPQPLIAWEPGLPGDELQRARNPGNGDEGFEMVRMIFSVGRLWHRAPVLKIPHGQLTAALDP